MAQEKHRVRMAMPDAHDTNVTIEFLNFMDFLFDSRMHTLGGEDNWERDMDEDDPDRKRMLKTRKNIAEEERISESDVDNRLVLFEIIKRKYMSADCCWRRVIHAGQVAIANACDPNADTVEWHPFIERCMEDAILGE